MNSRKLIFRVILAVVVAGALYRYFTSKPTLEIKHLTGETMGSIEYNVKYVAENSLDYKNEIDSLLKAFNQSLSTYIPDSEISQLNKTARLEHPSDLFKRVMEASKSVNEASHGAFDPTVGPLVNVWGFGPDKVLRVPDSAVVDSLRTLIGFSKIQYKDDVVEVLPGTYLDFSAIAKGYAVDLVAELLASKGLENYMVEIGGEVVAKGVNAEGEIWKIGIEDPVVARDERKLLAIVKLKDMAMATSGNYRNYYQVGERIIAHTIDPRTGYNTDHHLLSASVFAPTCMEADAYATAFMVLGVKGSKNLLDSLDLEGFLIYQDSTGELSTFVSEGLADLVEADITRE